MKSLFKILVIGVFFSLLFYACENNEDGVIKIGVVLPMTGDLSSYGEPMKEGMLIALEELNQNQEKYDLIFIDSKAEPKTAINGLQKLINVDKVNYVIGDVSSPVTLAMVPIIEQKKIFLLSPGASSPKLNNISPFFARNYPSSVIESFESAQFLAQSRGISNSALIYVNSEYGLGLRDVFTSTYEKSGGNVIFSEAYKEGKTDFRDIIIKINQANPEAIYLGGNQKEMGSFMRQLRESGSDALVLSNISFLRPDCLNIAGEAANGVIVPVAYYNPMDSSYSAAYQFANEYKEKFSKEVSIPVAVGYDAVMLIDSGINKYGNSPEKVASYIRNLKNYDGALGKLDFTNGEVRIPIEFKVIKNGEPVSLKDQ